MTSVSMVLHPANPKLWAVQSYIALISGDGRLVPGNGLKRLRMMSSGLNTYNDEDIACATTKADDEGYFNGGLHGFMVESIVKNCKLYAMMMQHMLSERIKDISTGSVSNPQIDVKYSNRRARRNYYIPPFTFIQKVQKALIDDNLSSSDTPGNLWNLANDAEFILNQLQGREGYMDPQPTCFSSIMQVVDRLVNRIEMELMTASHISSLDYKAYARPCLKIIWFIAKLLMGDLTVIPSRENLAVVDLNKTINMSDATLACIPFPTPQTIALFSDSETIGVSMKGRTYLGATSLAVFDTSREYTPNGNSAAPG